MPPPALLQSLHPRVPDRLALPREFPPNAPFRHLPHPSVRCDVRTPRDRREALPVRFQPRSIPVRSTARAFLRSVTRALPQRVGPVLRVLRFPRVLPVPRVLRIPPLLPVSRQALRIRGFARPAPLRSRPVSPRRPAAPQRSVAVPARREAPSLPAALPLASPLAVARRPSAVRAQ